MKITVNGLARRIVSGAAPSMMRTFLSTRAIAFISAVLLLVIAALYLYALDSAVRAKSRDDLYRGVISASVLAERRLERAFSTAVAVATVIQQNRGRYEDLGPLVSQLIRNSIGLANVQIAPLGRVRAVYPPQQAARRRGRDLTRDPAWREALGEARRSRTMVMLPPQPPHPGGHHTVTSAMPVFVRDGGLGAERFWGFVLAEVDLQQFLAGLALPGLLGRDTRYALTTDTVPPTVLATTAPPPEQPIMIPLSAPSGTWQLLAEPARGWSVIYGMGEIYLMLTLLLALTAMLALITMQRGQMRKLALYDGLTGLPNRQLFFERATQAIARARRLRTGVGVLFIDADRFKSVNDRFGHDAGDAVLRHIATRLRALLRESDVVARLAGDEFVLMLPDIDSREELEVVADKIRDAMREPAIVRGRPLPVTVSTGASLYPVDGERIEALLRHADDRMYRAKRAAAGGSSP